MKVSVSIIFTTYEPRESKIDVLLHKSEIPSQTVIKYSVEEVIHSLAQKYVDIDPKYFTFKLIDAIHIKECGKLNLYYYVFLPHPAPIKKGEWNTAWEIYREEHNEKIFEVIQEAARRATERIQSGIR